MIQTKSANIRKNFSIISNIRNDFRYFFDKIKIYRIFLLLYLTGGAIAIILSVLFKFNREQIGVAFTIGSIISLVIPKDFQIYAFKERRYIFNISIIFWMYIALFSLIVFKNSIQNYYLPLIYFILISFLILIITIQILISEKLTKIRIGIILLEIITLSLILSGSNIYLFPAPYGNDSLFHTTFISNIVTTGSIENSNVAQYQVYPIYQILFAETILILNLDLKMATLMMAFIQILFLLFIFLLTEKLFFNSKIAAIATLLVSISTNMLVPRYSFFPGSFSVIFFIFFLYLCLTSKLSFKSGIILTILIISNFTHPILPFIISFSTLIMFIFSKLFRMIRIDLKDFNIQKNLIFLSLIIMLIQWTRPIGKGNYSLFSNLIDSIKFTFEEGASVTQATSSPFYNWSDIFMYELGFTLLILFGIGGALWFLRIDSMKMDNSLNRSLNSLRYANGNRTIAAITTLMLIPMPYILAIVYPNSIPARWFIFIETIAGIFAGAIIFIMYENLSKYKLGYLILIPIFLLGFFSITSPTSNPNSHIYANELATKNSLSDPELSGANFVNKEIDEKNIHGSASYLSFINRKIDNPKYYINPNESKTYKTGIVLIRDSDIKKGFGNPLFGRKGKLAEIYRTTNIFLGYLDNIDKIYENGGVKIYLNG